MSWVWGVDVSTTRIAFAFFDGETVEHRSLGIAAPPGARRLAVAHEALQALSFSLNEFYPPESIWVEQPVGRYTSPTLLHMVGVTMGALYDALKFAYAHPVSVMPISVTEWKKHSVGHGNASKEQIHTWAASHGWDGDNQDETDAAGMAVAAWHMTRVPSDDRVQSA